MSPKLAAIIGIVFLLLFGVPSLPSSAATSTRHTTSTMFSYNITLYPGNSSWSASITNIGSSVVWNTVSISNATIQDNQFLLSTLGNFDISPGQTVHGSFPCQFFNGTSGSDESCTLTRGATYRFCTSVGNNTGTITFDELLGCFNVKADGVTRSGSTYRRIDLTWRTSIDGGAIAKWHFNLRNIGTQTVRFYVTLSWQCMSPIQGWLTCVETSPSFNVTRGNSHSFIISFKPRWNSIPVGKGGLTVTVWASYGKRMQLDENAYNLTAVV